MRPPHLPPAVRSKRTFFDHYQRRHFGNTLRTWGTLKEGPAGPLLMARSMDVLGGGTVLSNLDKRGMRVKAGELGLNLNKFRFNECAPDEVATLQGEVFEDAHGLQLFAHIRQPAQFKQRLRMRDVLPLACPYSGIVAQHILRQHLNEASYADLVEILELYPGHVVEFAAYSRQVGWCTGRNTIIWEVRDY